MRPRIGYIMKRRTFPALMADVPRHGAHPPKLNGCGKFKIVIGAYFLSIIGWQACLAAIEMHCIVTLH